MSSFDASEVERLCDLVQTAARGNLSKLDEAKLLANKLCPPLDIDPCPRCGAHCTLRVPGDAGNRGSAYMVVCTGSLCIWRGPIMEDGRLAISAHNNEATLLMEGRRYKASRLIRRELSPEIEGQVCPFCLGPCAVRTWIDGGYLVECDKCSWRGPVAASTEDAVSMHTRSFYVFSSARLKNEV